MSAKNLSRKKKDERASVVDQWIEVEVIDGATRTTRYPDDEEVNKLIEKKQETTGRDVDLIYRRFNFVDGVPPEYFWTTRDAARRLHGGHAIQRLQVDDWHRLRIHENGGHLTPSPWHMPRPESRGGCECPACLANAERLERLGR